MVKIYVDDIRKPEEEGFIHFLTVNDTLGYMRRIYKQGVNEFYLDLDNDAGDYGLPEFGNDYIEILNRLETLHNMGHMKYLKLKVHIHTMNPVARERMQAIIKENCNWMEEV